jgi:hypothetical protein
MSYTIQNDWLRKDVLDSTAAGKVISGAHFYNDFVAIQNEFSNKAEKAGSSTQTFQALTPDVGDNTNKVATTAFVTTTAATKQDTLTNITDATTANGYGTRTVSTSAPSGGVDGDVWYRY